MNLEVYTNLLNQPEALKNEQVSELKSIIKKYPFFQSARALHLKGLKDQESFRYNNELKVTAAYTTDRSVLFDFITSKTFEKQFDIHQQITEKISREEVIDPEEIVSVVEEKLDLGKPLNFSKKETHSFQEWLQLSTKEPITRKQQKSSEKKVGRNLLIDRFIKNNPKITPIEKEEKIEVSISKNKADKSLMTQTLAKVYLEQKKFSKAIKAYEILSLKYPEKSGFFAVQIRTIKILQKNKS
ncbi:MAG: hypothetical protein JKY02_10135 [Flavobacteriaceae bacterium]|nr:hypothetical protein [Flavobacteriaceae bacterium]